MFQGALLTRKHHPADAVGQLIPPARIPGFIFHQTERTDDNGTFACSGAGSGAANHWLCYDMNARDFDLLGYKYSLLSTVGTAGQNLVVTMIPARDTEEFSLFPAEDTAFIQHWVNWTDTNLKYLRNTMPIATLPGPGLGTVDGTAAMSGDEGYVFLFNPNLRITNASLAIDESLGLSNASAGARCGPGSNPGHQLLCLPSNCCPCLRPGPRTATP